MWKKLSKMMSRIRGTPAAGSGRARRRRPRFRPGIEGLEGRLVPAVIAVTTFADVVNPADGLLSLREAISRANATAAPDAVVLKAGVYRLSIPYNPANPDPNATGSFDITASTTLVGVGAGKTVVDGGKIDRVFAVTGTSPSSINALFQGLTVTGGNINGDGGGILLGNAALTLRDCVVRDNVASGSGGGISNALARGTGNLTLIRSVVRDNHAVDNGGGIFLRGNAQGQGSTLRLFNSTVCRNTTNSYGGGIHASRATLTNSTVCGNKTTGLDDSGGGIYAGTASLTNSTVSGNRAGYGGGIHAVTTSLLNSTVSGNTAAKKGGGIIATSMTLLNATITKNLASNAGGVYHDGANPATVKNTIIAQNSVMANGSGPDVYGVFTSAGHNLIGIGTGSTGFGVNGDQVGTINNPIDARLAPLAFNGGRTMTHRLLLGSRAIDRGDNAGVSATDQRGFARRRDGDRNRILVVDIGAFEL
jgi:predicted outer membrane repeat protein